MVLQEFSYQTVIDGVFPKLTKHKKRSCPKFLMSIGTLKILNPTHVSLLGKEISTMNLGEASKRMHDPIFYLANIFKHEAVRFQYSHENDLDDSMFLGATNFKEEMSKITDPYTKYLLVLTLS